ncbi:hypothetical protein LguiB_024579 [Lonicera macranthoides]
MEKNYSDKSGSFTGRGSYKKKDSPSTNEYSDTGKNNSSDKEHTDHDHDHNLDQVSQDVDQFTHTLTAIGDKSSPPEVPDSVEKFAKIIEARISKYYSGDAAKRSRKMKEDDLFFIDAVNRMAKLTNAFREYPSNSSTSSSLNRTSMVLQRAMALLEEEFRALLEDSRTNHSNSKSLSGKNASFNAKHDDSDRCQISDNESNKDDDFPSYSPDIVAEMTKIATAMVSAGYETECCQVYTIARRNAFDEQMKKLEFEKLNIEDVQKMHWEPLEGEVARWIRIVKKCSTVLFPGEHKLGEAVFADYPVIHRSLFGNLARAVVIQLLDFVEAIAMTKRSAEKLFKFLDMYETLRDLIPAVVPSPSTDYCEHELKSEINATGNRIGEAVVNIFCDLENSIKSDVAKTPVPGGAVHPLTRYVMNYLKYACEYKDTLEQIFQQHAKLEKTETTTRSDAENDKEGFDPANLSPVSAQLLAVMDLLDSNLEAKSRLYKDLSLRYIFLMNNGRYILQKVKGSAEIHQLMGNTWCRRRSTEVRQFHKNYQRETWGRLLQCLGHEGLQVNGKVQKPVLKERFKNFNTMFDEIHKTQSTWVVSDEQLLSELRVSVSAVVIPAYRSFVGRFSQYFDGGRQTEKYIKYQPEDIEMLIEGLFDGNPTSMGRRR